MYQIVQSEDLLISQKCGQFVAELCTTPVREQDDVTKLCKWYKYVAVVEHW